jgi:hypothetical protein
MAEAYITAGKKVEGGVYSCELSLNRLYTSSIRIFNGRNALRSRFSALLLLMNLSVRSRVSISHSQLAIWFQLGMLWYAKSFQQISLLLEPLSY